jgi:hypothetical protein
LGRGRWTAGEGEACEGQLQRRRWRGGGAPAVALEGGRPATALERGRAPSGGAGEGEAARNRDWRGVGQQEARNWKGVGQVCLKGF